MVAHTTLLEIACRGSYYQHDPKMVVRNVDKHSVAFCGAMNKLLFCGCVCQSGLSMRILK